MLIFPIYTSFVTHSKALTKLKKIFVSILVFSVPKIPNAYEYSKKTLFS